MPECLGWRARNCTRKYANSSGWVVIFAKSRVAV